MYYITSARTKKYISFITHHIKVRYKITAMLFPATEEFYSRAYPSILYIKVEVVHFLACIFVRVCLNRRIVRNEAVTICQMAE